MIKKNKIIIIITLVFICLLLVMLLPKIKGELFKRTIDYIYVDDIKLTNENLSKYTATYIPGFSIDIISKGGGSTGKVKFKNNNELEEMTYAYVDVYEYLYIVYNNKKYYFEKK